MAKSRTLEEKLMGAAVVKTTFRLRGDLNSPMFNSLYPGLLEDLGLQDEQVDAFIEQHREDVDFKARSALKLTQ